MIAKPGNKTVIPSWRDPFSEASWNDLWCSCELVSGKLTEKNCNSNVDAVKLGKSTWWPLLGLLSWCHIFEVKSLQLIWRFHLRMPYQICSNELQRLDSKIGLQDSSPHNGYQGDMFYCISFILTHDCYVNALCSSRRSLRDFIVDSEGSSPESSDDEAFHISTTQKLTRPSRMKPPRRFVKDLLSINCWSFQSMGHVTRQLLLSVFTGPKCVFTGPQAIVSAHSVIFYWCSGPVDSLWPIDAIWRLRSGPSLAQVMACCLTTTSHNRVRN